MARKKIEIKRIENENRHQVCFSKRRQGLFTKASELSILCGATVGYVVFSTSGTPFTFGHPSINEVVDRFRNSVSPSGSAMDNVHRLNMKCLELQQDLDSENKKKDRLQEAIEKEKAERMMQWWNANALELGLVELQEFQKCLEAVDGAVKEETNQILGLVPPPPMEIASTSQYQFGHHISADSMVFTGPSSSNAFADRFEANDPLRSGGRLEDVCGLGNFPNNQNHG